MELTTRARQVAVRLKVTVDPVEWEAIYGRDATAAEIKAYVEQTLRDCAAAEDGALVAVEGRGV